MSGLLKIGAVVAVLVILGSLYVSAYNKGVSYENQIQKGYENMEQILGQYSLKIAESAQLPAAMRDDLKDVMRTSLQARYGEDGSQAAVQFIKENYAGQIDSKLYVQIQQLIEAGRNQFQNEQTAFLDVRYAYEAELKYFWSGLWLKIAGYPKLDLSKYQAITSRHAQKTFETGVDEGIQMRREPPTVERN